MLLILTLEKYTQGNQEFQFLLRYITSSSSAWPTRDSTAIICFKERKNEKETEGEKGRRNRGHIDTWI